MPEMETTTTTLAPPPEDPNPHGDTAPEDLFDSGYTPPPPPEDPHKARPFATWDYDMLRDLPDPSWVIGDTIPADGLTAIVGPPKQMKTFYLLGALLSVATGRKHHGREVEQGPVLYAAGEGLRGLKWRIGAWVESYPEAERAELERLIKEFFHVIPHAFKVYDPTDADRFVATCEARNIKAAAMDTYARMMTGGDENSSQDAGLAVATCDRARTASGGAIIIVHHTTADGTRGRGSTAVLGAVNTEINVRKEGDGQVLVRNTAQKEAAEFNDRYYNVLPVAHSIVLRESDQAYPSAAQGAAGNGYGAAGFGGGGFGGGGFGAGGAAPANFGSFR